MCVSVCRLCLATDAPMRIISNSPLQDVYHRLTNITLNAPQRPVVACPVCYSRLWKSHDLMVRSVRADEVLTQILDRGEIISGESITIRNYKAYQLCDALAVTPVEIITFTGTGHDSMETDIKEELLPAQDIEEMETHGPKMVTDLKFKESEYENDMERATLEDMDDIDSQELTHEGDIKHEKSEEAEITNIQVSEGAAPGKNCEQRAEKTEEDRSTLTPAEKNDQERRTTHRTVEEAPSRRVGAYMLRSSTNTAKNKHVSLNMSRCSETAMNEGNVIVDEASACTSTHTAADDVGSKHLTKTYVCNKCGTMFDNKHLLIEHIHTHNTVKWKSNWKSDVKSSGQHTIDTNLRTDIVNKHTDTHSGKSVIECAICRRRFTSKRSLIPHMRTHTGEKPFKCELCQQRFTIKSNLNRHLITHTGEKPYECTICQHKFTQKSSLTVHTRIHTGERRNNRKSGVKISQQHTINKKLRRRAGIVNGHTDTHSENNVFECATCQRQFTEKYHLIQHIRTHAEKKPFKCELCQQTFTVKCNLNKHLMTHTGEKPYECTICKHRFTQKYNLTAHFRTHTGEKPFKCTICPRRFTEKRFLNKHLFVHTGQLFECEICQKKFNQKFNFNMHLKIHTGEKSFKCEVCGVGFYRKEHLNSHLKKHTGEKPFECEICKHRFSHKNNLKTHLERHAGEKRHECKICKHKFVTQVSLYKHLKKHTGEKPFQCETCQRSFTVKFMLDNHVRTHTEETPFECNICQRRFSQKVSMNRHLKLHTGEKPHECEICQKRFIQKGCLIAHLKTHSASKFNKRNSMK